MNPNFATVGAEFVKVYYELFQNNRGSIGSLYRPNSMLTYEGQQFQGDVNIVNKFKQLPFQEVAFVVTTIDAHPAPNFGVFVMVIGQLKTDNDTPHSYAHSFLLMPSDGQSYYIHNEIFRLALHNA